MKLMILLVVAVYFSCHTDAMNFKTNKRGSRLECILCKHIKQTLGENLDKHSSQEEIDQVKEDVCFEEVMADVVDDISSGSSSEGEEPKKRTLTVENINMDEVSCMKCDEDCPDARSLDCGHLFCLECITDEVKKLFLVQYAAPSPSCQAEAGKKLKTSKEASSTSDNADPTTEGAVASDVIQNGDDFPTYDLEVEAVQRGEDVDVAEEKEDEVEEEDKDSGEDQDGKEEDGEEVQDEEETEGKEDAVGDDAKKDSEVAEGQENGAKVQVCPRHQEPLVKNRCKTCRAIKNRVKKMQKIVGNKVQVCDGHFADINNLQTAIHTGMDKVKKDIQERSKFLIAEIQKLEQQELANLQQHREQRVEKLRECGQTLMDVAKGIRDELAVVQDKLESTQDGEFKESLKELRKACGKKIPQPDQKLKLIVFVPGREERLPELFGKIDEKPKE